jgi:hypothetical protein
MLIKCASLLPREILHVEVSFNLIGILNRECAVLPPSIKSAAIPEEATGNAISPHNLTFASIVLYKNVLPVPPGPSTKKHSEESCSNACITALYIACCSALIREYYYVIYSLNA